MGERQEEEADQEAQAARPPRQTEVRLTARDLEILRWIGEQCAVRADQVARLLARHAGPGLQTPGTLSESATHVWRTRMKRIGAIGEVRGFYNEPSYIWLTARGLSLAGLDYRVLKPALTSLRHLYWCNEVRLYVFMRRPEAHWIPERTLRSEYTQAHAEQGKLQAPDIPDALVETPNGVVAVEVELTNKQQSRLVRLIRRRASDPRYSTIWYFCSAETCKSVTRARTELAEAQRAKIKIYHLPEPQKGNAHAQQTAPGAADAATTEFS